MAAAIRDRVIEFRRVRYGDLVPHPRNPWKHPEKQRKALDAVLQEVGYAGAVLTRLLPDGRLGLIDGQMRSEQTPDQELPVLVTDLTADEAEKLLATFNAVAGMAEPDKERLEALLLDVQVGSRSMDGLLADMRRRHGIEAPGTGQTDPDDVPEPPAEPITKPGDLWRLGEHRLLCGDSTKAEDVGRLMGGAKVQCIFTDPPYGVSIAKKNRLLNSLPDPKGGGNTGIGRNALDIVDDDLTPEQLEATLLQAFVNAREVAMADDCTLFVCSPQGCGLSMMMMMMMQKAGLKARHVLIWVKNQPTFSMGRLDYDYQHEPILLTWGKRHKRPMLGQHKTSVWRVDKPRKSAEHPTMKPVELYANAYANNSDQGDNVLDLYAGSGTAFIAAEQLGRRCYAIEIEPRYVDVAVRRWEAFTGKKSQRDRPSKPAAKRKPPRAAANP